MSNWAEHLKYQMMSADNVIKEMDKLATGFFSYRKKQAGILRRVVMFSVWGFLFGDEEQINMWKGMLRKEVGETYSKREKVEADIEELIKGYLFANYDFTLPKKALKKIEKAFDVIKEKLDRHNGSVKHPEYLSPYQLEQILERMELFVTKIETFNNWSAEDSLEMLANCFQLNANYLKKYGHSVNSEKDYKRCSTAVKMLQKIVSRDDMDYPPLQKFYERHPIEIRNHRMVMTTNKLSEEQRNKQLKNLYKKAEEWYKGKVDDTFSFIKKYWRHWTD